MAIARLRVKVGKKGYGAAHAEYIGRTGAYASKRESSPEELEALRAGNMPEWAKDDPIRIWREADVHERLNGTTYREMEIALPRELTPEQRTALVEEWVEQELGDRHAYLWAIHVPKAADGEDQPHVHLMFNENYYDGIQRDPEKFFKKYNSKNPERGGQPKGWGDKPGTTLTPRERRAELKRVRGRWEEMCNKHLERAGRDERIDMRSYKDQGLNKSPEIKQLPSEWRTGEGKGRVLLFRGAREAAKAARAEAARELAADLAALPGGKSQGGFERMPLNKLRDWVQANRPLSIEERVAQDKSVAEAKARHLEAERELKARESKHATLARKIERDSGASRDEGQRELTRLEGVVQKGRGRLQRTRDELQAAVERARAQELHEDVSGKTKSRQMRYERAREVLEQRDVVHGNVQQVVRNVSELARSKRLEGDAAVPPEIKEYVDRMVEAQGYGPAGEKELRVVLRKELTADPSAAAKLRQALERGAVRDSRGSEGQASSRGGRAGTDRPRGAGGRPDPVPGAQEPAGAAISKDQPGNKGGVGRSGGKSGKELPVTPKPSKTTKKIEQEKPKSKKDRGLDWEI